LTRKRNPPRGINLTFFSQKRPTRGKNPSRKLLLKRGGNVARFRCPLARRGKGKRREKNKISKPASRIIRRTDFTSESVDEGGPLVGRGAGRLPPGPFISICFRSRSGKGKKECRLVFFSRGGKGRFESRGVLKAGTPKAT